MGVCFVGEFLAAKWNAPLYPPACVGKKEGGNLTLVAPTSESSKLVGVSYYTLNYN
jgi:hypothetical protein